MPGYDTVYILTYIYKIWRGHTDLARSKKQ